MLLQSELAALASNVKLQPGAFLQVADDAEEITRLRIAAWSKHPNETLGGRIRSRGQLLKSNGSFDVVAHDGLAGIEIAGQHRVNAFAQKRFGEFCVALNVAFDQIAEAFCFCH